MKQGWEIKKLGEVFDLQMGKTPNRDNRSYWGGNNIWLSISDIKDKYVGLSKETITDLALKESNIKKVKSGTVIMSFKLTVGRTAITITDLYTNEAIMAFIPKEDYNILPEYTYYYLSHYKWENSNKAVMGITLNKKVISDSYFEFPEREEQERIVGELDCLSGIIAAKRAQLRELDTLAQSIFYTMFGDPITNDKGWQTKKLGDVALIVGGSTPSTREETNWNGDLNWVTPAELNGTLYYGETQRKITTEGARGLELLPVGTVLLSSRAPIGKLAITTVPMYCNQGFKNVVCGESINNIYVYYYLLATIENVKALGVGATFKEVSKRAVENYHILVPPIDLQRQFAEKIENIERQKELITKSIKETEDLFNSRMDYYFN